MLKSVLSGLILSQDELKTKWEGVSETLTEDNFTIAFKMWLEHCKKVVCIGNGFTDKKLENIFFDNLYHFCCISPLYFGFDFTSYEFSFTSKME
jgi:hypothetical protein